MRMRDDSESAETTDVIGDVTCFASQRIWRLRNTDRDVMAALRAQFDSINDEHSRSILRRVRRACTVAMIRQDDEVEAGARRSRRRIIGRSGSVRAVRM